MKKPAILALSAIVLACLLFFFGRTTENKKKTAPVTVEKTFDIKGFINDAKSKLTPSQSIYLSSLENSITRGDLVGQKITLYGQLASYWRDSVGNNLAYVYYTAEKAKLENTEKNLNFAAQSYLDGLKSVSDPSLRSWMANEAQSLFDKILKINPENDSAKVGWGSTFIFGASGAPMEGIMKIREVAEKDSTFMYAQFMLGYGAMMTGQFDRAIERLLKVVSAEPDNTEAIFLLAEAYERAGKKAEAVKWYVDGKKKVTNPELLKAIDEKIKTLQ